MDWDPGSIGDLGWEVCVIWDWEGLVIWYRGDGTGVVFVIGSDVRQQGAGDQVASR